MGLGFLNGLNKESIIEAIKLPPWLKLEKNDKKYNLSGKPNKNGNYKIELISKFENKTIKNYSFQIFEINVHNSLKSFKFVSKPKTIAFTDILYKYKIKTNVDGKINIKHLPTWLFFDKKNNELIGKPTYKNIGEMRYRNNCK